MGRANRQKFVLLLVAAVGAWMMFVVVDLHPKEPDDTTTPIPSSSRPQQQVQFASSSRDATSIPVACPVYDHATSLQSMALDDRFRQQSSPAAQRCREFESHTDNTIGSFTFYGKQMNTSSACPTAGMNNQLVMLLGFIKCAQSKNIDVFLWKDISCSPTGGKDKGGRFAVGSDDYDYAWFRWSEVFDIHNPVYQVPSERSSGVAFPEALPKLCFRDEFTWSENKQWMQRCPPFIDHFYGTKDYWSLRSLLPVRQRYVDAVRRIVGDKRYLALHVRRGDYQKFCKETKGSSGEKKFRIAPYKWLGRNATSLSRSFLGSCAPSSQSVFAAVKDIVGKSAAKGMPYDFIFLATNSPGFTQEFRTAMTDGPQVMTLADVLQANRNVPEVCRVVKTHTDKVVMDILLLSMGSDVILNRYSTFSQSVIDFHVLHQQGRDSAGAGTVGMKVYWW